MLTCPVCRSEDVRRSHRNNLYSLIKRWRGLRRYRCRECRKIFYMPLSPLEQAVRKPFKHEPDSDALLLKEPLRKKNQRRIIELLLFLIMVAVFYFVLKALSVRF